MDHLITQKSNRKIKMEKNLQKRRDDERNRRATEKQLLDKIKSIIPFISQSDSQFSKNEILRSANGYMKFMNTFRTLDAAQFIKELNTKLLFSTGNANYVILDGTFTVMFSSENTLKQLGYKDRDIYGSKLTNLIHTKDRGKFVNEISFAKNFIINTAERKKRNLCMQFRMYEKKHRKNNSITYQLVRFEGTMEFYRHLVTNKVEIKHANNGHFSIEYDHTINYDSAIIIRGSIVVLKDYSLSSQINYRFTNNEQYHLLMNLDGMILYADHRIVNVIGFQPVDVIGKSAYSFICPDDQQFSLYLHTKTLRSSDGTGEVVHRLRAINNTYIYIKSCGKLEHTETTILFHVLATALSEEQGEKIRRETLKLITPYCVNKTTVELKCRVDEIANSKLALKKEENHGGIYLNQNKRCTDFERTTEETGPNISHFYSAPTIHDINSSSQVVVGQFVENAFIPASASALTYHALIPEQLSFTSKHDSSRLLSPYTLLSALHQESRQSQLCCFSSSPQSMPSTPSSANCSNPEIMVLSNEAQCEERSISTNGLFFGEQHNQYGTGSFRDKAGQNI